MNDTKLRAIAASTVFFLAAIVELWFWHFPLWMPLIINPIVLTATYVMEQCLAKRPRTSSK